MSDLRIMTSRCMVKPSYHLMLQAYQYYLIDSAPCKGGARNQCAVRMSVALERCGLSLSAFRPPRRVHRNRASCRLSIPHVLGASELARYLRRLWGVTHLFRRSTLDEAAASLAGHQGIIYFSNCYRRRSGGPRRGDHIDLWDGQRYYNQVIHLGAGGDAGADAPLFDRADQVWFFRL